jgi:hypothetical protein
MTPFEKAEHAKRLLDDPVLNAAIHDIRMKLVGQLESAPISDVELQHEVALMLQLLKRIRTQFEQYVQEHAMVQHAEKQRTFMDRMRRKG